MPRKVANFSFDRRGPANLLTHANKLITDGLIDTNLSELNLNGTRAHTIDDRRHIQKVVSTFTQIRTIFLKGCCLQNVDFLAQDSRLFV